MPARDELLAKTAARRGKPQRLGPRELPASLPVEALVEAWTDFVAELRARREAVELQRGTSDLLG